MKLLIFLALGSALAVTAANALVLQQRGTPGVFPIDLQKRPASPFAGTRKNRRAGEVSTPDLNYLTQLLYIVQLEIGTPPQSTYVQLDTGSSDLVVETPNSDVCSTAPPNPCTNFGAYSANSSSTYVYLNSNMVVAYGGGDGATGDYALDTVSIGGAVLQNLQFGIMYKSTVLEGILGVSFQQLETQVTFSGQPQYPNLPTLLVNQGYIASRAFSLYTNDDQSAAGGTLLFGGVDTDKYCGNLVTINLVVSGFDGATTVNDFSVNLLGVTGTSTTGTSVSFSGGSTTTIVLLDSGTTLTMLPSTLVNPIWAFVGATPYSNDANLAYVPCSTGSSTQKINFQFSGITISVPLSQLVVFNDGSGFCTFGIGIGSPIIGDTVLSSMYVVYDLDNKQVSLAPAILNAAGSNVVQIMAGPNGVPHQPGASSCPGATSSTTTTTTSSTTTSTTSSTTTTTATKTSMHCNSDNCLRAFQHTPAATAFCNTYTAGGAQTLPPYAAASCTAASRVSSACSCLVTTGGPTVTPMVCLEDNCLRAIEHAAGPFCKSYLSGMPVATPTNVVTGCMTLSSRISSGCSCYTATATTAP